jgi:hypothetical protein
MNNTRNNELYKDVEILYTCKMETLVGFEILTAVAMDSSIFWDITPRSPFRVNRSFRRTCRIHLQDRRISRARNQLESK